jgi:NAD(P)-dependent dehydrogenase (short-subunit alcohol dehydrogenase family)
MNASPRTRLEAESLDDGGSAVRPIDQTTVLVTGATDGLGRGVAADLASRGATVLLHGRSPERLERTLAELRDETGSEKLRTYRADFASLAEVRAMAAEVTGNEERLDALVNNAGIGFLPEREFSRDGVELVLQVDYLAGYLLTRELLPLIQASAPSRIVFVASAGQAPIDFDDPMMDQGYDAGRAYCQAKLAQINQTMEMAARLDGDVAVTALHPSTFMPTKILGPGMDPRSTVQEGIDATGVCGSCRSSSWGPDRVGSVRPSRKHAPPGGTPTGRVISGPSPGSAKSPATCANYAAPWAHPTPPFDRQTPVS